MAMPLSYTWSVIELVVCEGSATPSVEPRLDNFDAAAGPTKMPVDRTEELVHKHLVPC